MKVLITGGLGGVGSHVTPRFLGAGHEVRVLELKTPLSERRLAALEKKPEIFWGDVTKLADVSQALEGVDAVIHLAAVIPPRADEDPQFCRRLNVGGTKTVLEAVRESGRPVKIVFTSSIATFGDTHGATEPLHPDRNPLNPHTPYERSKAEAELAVRESGLEWAVLRLGANPPTELSASKFKEMFIMPYETRIEFTHVADAATAILHAAERFDRVKGKVLIVSGGPTQQMLYHEFIARSMGRLGLPVPPKSKFSTGPSHLDWYDTAESQALLTFQERTLDDFLDDLYRPIPRPAQWLMRYLVGPLLGWAIVRLL